MIEVLAIIGFVTVCFFAWRWSGQIMFWLAIRAEQKRDERRARRAEWPQWLRDVFDKDPR